MHLDHQEYFRFTRKSRLDKAINSLLGIIEGLSVDSIINDAELQFLNLWLEEYQPVENNHPFRELLPVVKKAFADGVLTSDEKEDIVWLCEKLRSTEYYDHITADIQRLHALIGGIAADGVISEEELRGLNQWLADHEHLKLCWPYEEVMSLATSALANKMVTAEEHKFLLDFFTDFVSIQDTKVVGAPKFAVEGKIIGLCAVCPDIVFTDRSFCFTGASTRYKRSQFKELITGLGGRVTDSISAKLDYLIVGANGNPCWAYACYGRKVEKAVELRKSGARLLLVHESDLHDAIADFV